MLPGSRRLRGLPAAAGAERRADHHGDRTSRQLRRRRRPGGRGRRLRHEAVRAQGADRSDPGACCAEPRASGGRRRPSRIGDRIEVVPGGGDRPGRRREVHLTRTEFRLLCELAACPGRVFTRETLLEIVWGYDYVGDTKLVDVHIYRLRTKIEADPSEPTHLLTVRGLATRSSPSALTSPDRHRTAPWRTLATVTMDELPGTRMPPRVAGDGPRADDTDGTSPSPTWRRSGRANLRIDAIHIGTPQASSSKCPVVRIPVPLADEARGSEVGGRLRCNVTRGHPPA